MKQLYNLVSFNILRLKSRKSSFILVLLSFAVSNLVAQFDLSNTQIKKLAFNGYDVEFGPGDGTLFFRTENDKTLKTFDLKTQTITNSLFNKEQSTQSIIVRSSSDLTQIIINEQNKVPKIIQPLGINDYLNIQLSPDKTKLLFRVSGMDSYVTDLDGNIISKYDKAEFPVWVSNEMILFAEIEDDGYNYISSNLFLSNLKQDERVKITGISDLIPLYPDYSAKSKTIVFNTPEGDVYWMSFE